MDQHGATKRRPLGALPVRWTLLLMVLVALLTACAGPGADPGGNGQLRVDVVAPEGAKPRIVLVEPGGHSRSIEGSALVSGLVGGEYTLLASPLAFAGAYYVPDVESWRGRVEAPAVPGGTPTSVTITYAEAQPTGHFPGSEPLLVHPDATTYYLDCAAGDDSALGTAPEVAWRTLGRLAGLRLEPGDRVLLRRDCSWVGPLHVPWEGSQEWPVVIGAYGEGALPAIRDSGLNHVDITGSFLVIEQLQAYTSPGAVPVDARCGNQPVGWRTGFTLQHEAHHVTIRHSLAYGNTAGVHVTRSASHNRIVHNEFRDNVILSVNTDDGGSDDSGAWGLLLNGTDNVVAYNRFGGNNAWCSYDFGQEGASIEVYEAQRNLVHHNVSINDTTFSELGSSSLRDSEDNTFAYNVYVSHLPNSEFLVLRGPRASFGPTPGTRAFHNTVFLTHPDESQGVVCYDGCGPDMLELRNNVIWAEWKGIYVDAPIAESHNLFWNSSGKPTLQFFGTGNAMSETSRIADPRFVDAHGHDLRLTPGSPAIDAARAPDSDCAPAPGQACVPAFETDVTGVSLPQGGYDIGAHELAQP